MQNKKLVIQSAKIFIDFFVMFTINRKSANLQVYRFVGRVACAKSTRSTLMKREGQKDLLGN